MMTLACGCMRTGDTVRPVATAEICDAGRIADAVGKPVSDETAEGWRRQSGARTIRIVRPGMMVTADLRPDRLTVDVDAAGLATRVVCG
ncbi:I78 family peptidase inhibitor [Sphingomonas arantia]|uniref:I78 family peptidase inhibitor n=1 Tax=Sphingomonas arantia TaxID=1460676 RepID=A0ABW4TY22_9SPHN